MSAAEALRLAHENGISLTISGAHLILDLERKPEQAVLEAIKQNKAGIFALLGPDDDVWTADDWQAFFNERAGISEFDGGQSRCDAEALAFECCIAEWLDRHPTRSDPGRCNACLASDREEHPVVPFGTETLDHTWLHPECWQGWYGGRKAEAITTLTAMGIKGPDKFPNDFGKNGSD